MTTPENDSLIVEYDDVTHQMKLQWDDNDPKWNWLNNLTEQEIQEVISQNLKTLLEEDEKMA